VVISGHFDGVIFARGRVEIQPKGVVTGEVHSPCLVIDPGGIFDGRCTCWPRQMHQRESQSPSAQLDKHKNSI